MLVRAVVTVLLLAFGASLLSPAAYACPGMPEAPASETDNHCHGDEVPDEAPSCEHCGNCLSACPGASATAPGTAPALAAAPPAEAVGYRSRHLSFAVLERLLRPPAA